MLDKTSTQFGSFLFWRQPIPSLELSELEDLGISMAKSRDGKNSSKRPAQEEDDSEFLKFSTFNYWKEPIATIETLDFNLLL